ncbi:hypothetical protein [Acinetobacter gerneri]|uniref:hypothetical protein n=1 Tax=Acinetobacter gerneri TaxID=202952 RepID=UPI0032151D31
MQDNSMSRWLAPLMAFCVSFLIIAAIASSVDISIDRQLDFWLLWLGTMCILALPVVFLEIALAKRAKTSSLNALMSLTRDADASSKWRIVGWLAVVFIPFLSGAMLSNSSQILIAQSGLSFAPNLVFIGLAVVAFALSFLPRQILAIITALGVIASLVMANVMGTALQPWHMTALGFNEWGNATVLALIASGLGLGIYWQTNTSLTQQESAAKSALPIWIAQLLAVIAFGFFAVSNQITGYTIIAATLAATALLLQLAREQLQQRQISILIQFAVILIALLVWAIPQVNSIFNVVLMLWGLVICLIYSVFVGWIMKISHLRKAMNFSSELFYNVWRIFIRIILPLAIVIAMISVIGQLLA